MNIALLPVPPFAQSPYTLNLKISSMRWPTLTEEPCVQLPDIPLPSAGILPSASPGSTRGFARTTGFQDFLPMPEAIPPQDSGIDPLTKVQEYQQALPKPPPVVSPVAVGTVKDESKKALVKETYHDIISEGEDSFVFELQMDPTLFLKNFDNNNNDNNGSNNNNNNNIMININDYKPEPQLEKEPLDNNSIRMIGTKFSATSSCGGPSTVTGRIGKKQKRKHCKSVYPCQECNRVFPRVGDFNKHVRSVHQKLKPHSCPECQRGFYQRFDLKRHMKSIHLMNLDQC